MGDLGLDVIREPVGVVAGEDLAAGHGLAGVGGPHLLDVVMVGGVDNGRDVKVGEAVPAAELDFAEHARDVFSVGRIGIPVAYPRIRELNGGVLRGAHRDGFERRGAGVASEDQGTVNAVKSPEGH